MLPGTIPSLGLSAAGTVQSYQIARSLRFRGSQYLSRTTVVSTDVRKCTFSFWFKTAVQAATSFSPFHHPYPLGGNATSGIFIDQNNGVGNGAFKLAVRYDNAGTVTYCSSNHVFRDPGAWAHLVVAIDTTAANGLRTQAWLNGVPVTWSAYADMTQNTSSGGFNLSSYGVSIGAYDRATAGYFYTGNVTEYQFVDGQGLTASSFGQFDAITGAWVPVKYIGTYGNNGFYLNFADNSAATATTLGKDVSGNNNNWTPNNFSVTAGVTNDSLVDTPTNYGTDTGVGGEVRGNYATYDPLSKGNTQVFSGNLSNAGGNTYATAYSTIAVSSGKWFAEVICEVGTAGGTDVGIARDYADKNAYLSTSSSGYVYNSGDGNKANGGTSVAYGPVYGNNDVVGIALDLDARTVSFYKNGTSLGIAFSSLPAGDYCFATCTYYSANGLHINFGQRPFLYAAPSGFKALCTQNLPDPAIKIPAKYMDVALYTGNGSANAVTGKGFKPDVNWIKRRSANEHHNLTDSARGANITLYTSLLNGEAADTAVTAFNNDGFSLNGGGNGNVAGQTFVAWMWKEAMLAGVDIITYTGTGANQAVPHALGAVPAFYITKKRSNTSNWIVWHQNLITPSSAYLILNQTTGGSNSAIVTNGLPTASVINLGSDTDPNQSGQTYVGYVFADVPGFSKFGIYTGNGSADGPFVWCGFRPRWWMCKRIDAASAWIVLDAVRDPYNIVSNYLVPNSSNLDAAFPWLDFTSSGFKVRDTDAYANASGASYVYAAFAEAPFKYARAR